MSTTMRWVGLALLGVLIAVGVAVAASGLVSQQIGLASEPITAGDALAPAARSRPAHEAGGKHEVPAAKAPPPTTTTGPAPTTTEPQPAPPVPPSTTPVTPSGSNRSGGEGDHEGGGGGHADD